MKKYILLILLPLFTLSCDPADLQRVLDGASQLALSDADVANGLKEALNKGVGEAVTRLSQDGGYLQSAYKIALPAEAQTVMDKLKIIPGFENVEEEVIRRINRSAEDAATKASPIFVSAIRSLSFNDVMGILMGDNNAATQYLTNTTSNALYSEFKPSVVGSLNKFGALDYYGDAVAKYNSLPFVKPLNPDLADHVTGKALDGLYSLIAKKEMGIRTDLNQRTSDLLRRVFAKQD
jgi:hypothetical protein